MGQYRELTCAQLVELVTEYLDDALDPAERLRFEQHLDVCPHCAAYLAQIRVTVAAAGRLRPELLAPPMKDSLLHAFRTWHGESPA